MAIGENNGQDEAKGAPSPDPLHTAQGMLSIADPNKHRSHSLPPRPTGMRPATANSTGFAFPLLRLARPPSSERSRTKRLRELAEMKDSLDKQMSSVMQAMDCVRDSTLLAQRPLPPVPSPPAPPAPPSPTTNTNITTVVQRTPSPTETPSPDPVINFVTSEVISEDVSTPDRSLLDNLVVPRVLGTPSVTSAASISCEVDVLEETAGLRALLSYSHATTLSGVQRLFAAAVSKEERGCRVPEVAQRSKDTTQGKKISDMPSLARMLALGRQTSYETDKIFSGLLLLERMVPGSMVRKNSSWGEKLAVGEKYANNVLRYDQLNARWSKEAGVGHVHLRQLLSACRVDATKTFPSTEKLVCIVGEGLLSRGMNILGDTTLRHRTELGSVQFRKGQYMRVVSQGKPEQFALTQQPPPPFPPGYTTTRLTARPPPLPHPMASPSQPIPELVKPAGNQRIKFMKLPRAVSSRTKKRSRRSKNNNIPSDAVPILPLL